MSLLACNSIKKRLQYRCFSVKFTKFLRTPFFIGKLQWLLLRFNSCFQRSPDKNRCDCLKYILDLAEKGICCCENSETSTMAWSKMRTRDPGPGTLRPETWDPETRDSGTRDPGLWNWDPGTWDPETRDSGNGTLGSCD